MPVITRQEYWEQMAVWHDAIVTASGGSKATYDKVARAWRSQMSNIHSGIESQVFTTIHNAMTKIQGLNNDMNFTIDATIPEAEKDEMQKSTVIKADRDLRNRLR
jgi:hypothetical protein